MSIADRINTLLAENQIKPAQLSKETNITPATISRILNNIQIPTAENLYKIACFFHVSMEYIYTGREEDCGNATQSPDLLHTMELYRTLNAGDREEINMLMEYKISRYHK